MSTLRDWNRAIRAVAPAIPLEVAPESLVFTIPYRELSAATKDRPVIAVVLVTGEPLEAPPPAPAELADAPAAVP